MTGITEPGDFNHVFCAFEAIEFNQSAAMTDEERILTVNDLSVRFANRTAIQNLAFNVGPGETLAIIGPNGAGKTGRTYDRLVQKLQCKLDEPRVLSCLNVIESG